MLPKLQIIPKSFTRRQIEFAGIHREPGAAEGTLSEMMNFELSSLPELRSGNKKMSYPDDGKVSCMLALDGLLQIKDGRVLYRGQSWAQMGTTERQSAVVFGSLALFFPSGKFFDSSAASDKPFGENDRRFDGEIHFSGTQMIAAAPFPFAAGDMLKIFCPSGPNGARVKVTGVSADRLTLTTDFSFSEYRGSATACKFFGSAALRVEGSASITSRYINMDRPTPFSVGDTVRVSGTEKNDGCYRITAVTRDKKTLSLEGTVYETAPGAVLERVFPCLPVAFACGGRIWAAGGGVIRASAVGDPFNWEDPETGFYTDLGAGSNITGGCAFRSLPCFLEADRLTEVYGERPASMRLKQISVVGPRPFTGATVKEIGDKLYYLGPTGVMEYGGRRAVCVSESMGTLDYEYGWAAVHEGRYYLSGAEDAEGEWNNYVYDPAKKAWSEEYGFSLENSAVADGKLNACAQMWGSDMRCVWGVEPPEDMPVSWFMETNPIRLDHFGKKELKRIGLRLRAGRGADVTVSIMFEGENVWHSLMHTGFTPTRHFVLPVPQNRSSWFVMRIAGTGMMELTEFYLEGYKGSWK